MYGRTILGAALIAAAFGLGACDNGPTAANDAGGVTLGFSTATTAGASVKDAAAATILSGAAGEIVLEGTNGTLTISSVHFIVDEFKLGRDETACDEVEGEDDACEKYEAGPAFVALPLDGGTVPVYTAPVPAGTYVELKFEVKDAGPDDGDSVEEIANLVEDITTAGFTDWPANASMAVVGTFTPAGGEAIPFTAYFDAEIKVEMALDPALVIVDENGTANVEVDPALWFLNGDGTVLDLAAFDFATSGEVLEFEAKLEHGFSKIELEGFDD